MQSCLKPISLPESAQVCGPMVDFCYHSQGLTVCITECGAELFDRDPGYLSFYTMAAGTLINEQEEVYPSFLIERYIRTLSIEAQISPACFL
jgi:hypothetical protein